MAHPYELTQLDSYSFEHLVNFIGLKVLGNGVTGFAAGPDGGRDGFLEGKAPYPTSKDCWEGTWYIQSKFHKPNLSGDHQKWLIKQVINEIRDFQENSKRIKPDNWIIATNIEPSGHPQTGAYDKIKSLVKKFAPEMNVDIWGGRKILDYLAEYPAVSQEYGHFLTPGHIISKLYQHLSKSEGEIKLVIEHFIISQFNEFSYTKLEQAGSGSDQRPKIYELFQDLPVLSESYKRHYFILKTLTSAASNIQKISVWNNYKGGWKEWMKVPTRSRVILLKGGPGQGKSTAGQYFSQIQRAAFILSEAGPSVSPKIREIAEDFKSEAIKNNYWPSVPRVPLFIELKDYANWYVNTNSLSPKNIIEYICIKVNLKSSFNIQAYSLREAFKLAKWFVNFDGLDEVPNDIKDDVAKEIISFTNEIIPSLDADVLVLCTTRPQGYSGQFDDLDSSDCTLTPLPPDIAIACAASVVKYNRGEEEYKQSLAALEAAMKSPQVRELMTTPLQSHIMAVVVRDGGRPPEKRWELYNNFYNIMKKRESMKDFPDPRIAILLREKDQLLKAIHDRLGMCLHARAEISTGAESALKKDEFKTLAIQTTSMLMDGDINDTVDTLMEATIERLVFVNTPDSSDYVRFDIRQLQEFFAAEFIHNSIDDATFQIRLKTICSEAHWREVIHFILSALVQQKKVSTIAIASNVLQELDDDPEYSRVRIYRKRLARGALLTLRLIEDGVLEQDKRIRNQFTKCLAPLWGIVESNIVSRILQIRLEQSSNWLLNNLIDCFIDNDYSESLSAGIILSFAMNETHPRIAEVKKRFLDAPEGYIDFTLSQYGYELVHASINNVQTWFMEYVIELYMSSTSNQKLLFAANKYLQKISEYMHPKLDYLNISKDKKEIIKFLYPSIDETFPTDRDLNNDIYCFISPAGDNISPYVKRGITLNCQLSGPYSFPVELAILSSRFLVQKKPHTLRDIITTCVENKGLLSSVPKLITKLIPLRFDEPYFDTDAMFILSLNDENLESYIQNPAIKDKKITFPHEYLFFTDSKFSVERWRNFFRDYPEIAIRMAVPPHFDRAQVEDAVNNNKKQLLEPIVEMALNSPAFIAKYFPIWPYLFNAFPEKANDLRKLFITCNPHELDLNCQISNANETFIINQANEQPFIAFLATSLLYGIYEFNSRHTVNSNFSQITVSQAVIEGFGLTKLDLCNLFRSHDNDKLIRASCFALYLSLETDNRTRAINDFLDGDMDKIVFEIFSEETEKLLTAALYNMLSNVNVINERLIELLGGYSSLIKNNHHSRILIQTIFERWRERSNSVVFGTGLLENWLAE